MSSKSENQPSTYCVFQRSGTLYIEENVVRVTSRDMTRDATAAPQEVFAFYYFDAATIPGTRVLGEQKNISKVYYINAAVFTIKQLSSLSGVPAALLRNLRGDGSTHAVLCRTGNFLAFDPSKDEVVTIS